MRPRHLRSAADLDRADVRLLLDDARRFEDGEVAGLAPSGPFSVGLLFLEQSLRTRLGFAATAVRLGGVPIDVPAHRESAVMSAPEPFADTLRVAAGMVDLLVARTPFPLEPALLADLPVPCVNAGDGSGEHPTQALIDLYAIERARGPVGQLRLCICGDLTTRCARSLIRVLQLDPPARLVLVAPKGRDDLSLSLSPELAARTERRSEADFTDVDVLYMAGLPERNGDSVLSSRVRARFALTQARLAALDRDGLVLTPMPIVDEIDPAVRSDPRMGFFEQSDRGVHVRCAILAQLVGDEPACRRSQSDSGGAA